MGIKVDFKLFEGKRYSNLVFVRALPTVDKRRRPIEVLCNCGETKVVDWDNLRSGKTKSCGCKQHKNRQEWTEHPLRKIWTGIKQRCYNPNNKAFKYYGGKGVVMCDEWVYDYPAFYKWCMKNGWVKGLDVDKDIKGNGMVYSPSTCCIISHKDNMAATDQRIVSKEDAKMIIESKLSGRTLAKELGVTRSIVYKIRNNTYWK